MNVNPDDELERVLAAIVARRDGIPLEQARHRIDDALARLEEELDLDLGFGSRLDDEDTSLGRFMDAAADVTAAAVALLGPPLPRLQDLAEVAWLAGEAIRAAGGWFGELAGRALTR
jgi:hypothetical protein